MSQATEKFSGERGGKALQKKARLLTFINTKLFKPLDRLKLQRKKKRRGEKGQVLLQARVVFSSRSPSEKTESHLWDFSDLLVDRGSSSCVIKLCFHCDCKSARGEKEKEKNVQGEQIGLYM